MKIGIDIRAIGRQRTGDESYTRGLVSALIKIDKENQYFLYTNTEDETEIKTIQQKIGLTPESKNVQIVPVLPASKALWTFWALPRQIAKNPVDVLHVQYITPLILPAKTKLVTTIADISFNFFPEHIKATDLFFLKTLIPLAVKKADKVIGVSDFTKREVIKFYHQDAKKIVGINNGIEEEFFVERKPEELNSVKEKYRLPDKFILYVGTHQPRKNIPLLIQAFKTLKEKHPDHPSIRDLKLVIVGKRGGHNSDKKIDETLKDLRINNQPWESEILFPGFIDSQDLPAVYQSATIFSSASLYEGFGLPVVEAMASGVPVVCSDSSCFPDITADAALIFKNNNLEDYVQQLFLAAADDPTRQDLITKGRQRAQDFSWGKAAKETLNLYKSA